MRYDITFHRQYYVLEGKYFDKVIRFSGQLYFINAKGVNSRSEELLLLAVF